MDVSVIMINYNTFDLTKDALNSIFENTKELDYEIILLDNFSPDGSGEKLRDLFGDRIIYIQTGGNLGTSRSFNIGLKHSQGKYILWLNSDILLKDNFIKQLFDYMESNSRCGICGGNLFDRNGKPAASYDKILFSGRVARNNIRLSVILFRKIFKRQLSLHFNYTKKSKKVGGIIGADFMVRKECFDQIGGLNEDIFMYGEETEFTYRLYQQTDFISVSVPTARLIHFDGASSNKDQRIFNEAREKMILTGISKYLKKCYGKKDVYLFIKSNKIAARRKKQINRLLRRQEQAEAYWEKEKFYKEYISVFDSFYNTL